MSWLWGDRWLYYYETVPASNPITTNGFYGAPYGCGEGGGAEIALINAAQQQCNANPNHNNNNSCTNRDVETMLLPMMRKDVSPDSEPNNNAEKNYTTSAATSPASLASFFLLMHGVATIVSIVLVAQLFEEKSPEAPLTVPTYMLAPADAACQAWIEGQCVEELEDLRWTALRGVAQLSEHKTRGLIADVNPAVLCLVVQTALAACFSPMFRRVRAAVLLGLAVLLLFQQVRWHLSFGGLLWCELMLLVTFFLTGTRRGYGAVEGYRLLGMPMLMVATLAVAGENDASALVVVYLSLGAMMLAWTAYSRVDETRRVAVAVNACLAFVPFLLRVGLRLEALARLPVAAPSWIWAALLFALVWLVLFVATHSLLPYLPHSSQIGLFFLDQMAHTVQVLIVLLGLLLGD